MHTDFFLPPAGARGGSEGLRGEKEKQVDDGEEDENKNWFLFLSSSPSLVPRCGTAAFAAPVL